MSILHFVRDDGRRHSYPLGCGGCAADGGAVIVTKQTSLLVHVHYFKCQRLACSSTSHSKVEPSSIRSGKNRTLTFAVNSSVQVERGRSSVVVLELGQFHVARAKVRSQFNSRWRTLGGGGVVIAVTIEIKKECILTNTTSMRWSVVVLVSNGWAARPPRR